MEQPTIAQQFKRHFVAIVSIAVALAGLGYNTWRNERTELNRNVRVAAFEMLKTLGELQVIVDYAYFRKDQRQGDPTQGMGKVLFIKDLAQVIPAPVPDDADRLVTSWREQGDRLETDNAAVQRVSEDIYRARRDVLEVIERLR